MSQRVFIGLDIGTTNVKAAALSTGRVLLASAERAVQTLTPQAGHSEQDPEALFQHVIEVLREVLHAYSQLSERVARSESFGIPSPLLHGIAISAAMHGLVAVDAAGRPLTRFMLWSDVRADALARAFRTGSNEQALTAFELYHRTGVPIHAMSPLFKIMWLRQHQPDVFQRTHKFLGIKEYIWYRLTGKYESDLSCASATGLLNIWQNQWDESALALAGISVDQLPTLVSPYHTSRFDDPVRALTHLSLPEHWLHTAPLLIGASDGACANVGSGAVGPGQVAVTIGTSAAIRAVVREPVLDEQMRTFCYRLDASHCIVGGASNNGANTLEWLRTAVFQSPLQPEDFANQALPIPMGAEGLRFLPYLYGERAPLWDAQATGSFEGLSARHGQAHFVRAVMEGVLRNLKVIAEALEATQPITTLYASGGFTRNRLWVRMLGEIFQKAVVVDTSGIDASLLGAVLLHPDFQDPTPSTL